MSGYDAEITKVPKPTATITIVSKGVTPGATIVSKPYTNNLLTQDDQVLTTEDGEEIYF